jgi:hypothetical protein
MNIMSLLYVNNRVASNVSSFFDQRYLCLIKFSFHPGGNEQ